MKLTTSNESIVLGGHTSHDTAHLTYAYCFGARLRCLRKEWVEQAQSGAQKYRSRFVTQTTDKRFNASYTEHIHRGGIEAANAWAEAEIAAGKVGWNKPHTSTYYPIVVMFSAPLPDDTGRFGIDYRTLSHYPTLERLNAFRDLLATGDPQFNESQQGIFDEIVRRTEVSESPKQEPAFA